MSDWIDEKSKLSPAPSVASGTDMPVIQVNRASSRPANAPATPNNVPAAAPASLAPNAVDSVFGSDAAPVTMASLPIARSISNPPQVPANDFPHGPEGVSVAPVLSTSPGSPVLVQPDSIDESKNWLDDFAFFYAVPSWMVSFIFHLVLILILALVTYKSSGGKNIELVLASEPADNLFEVAIDLAPMELEDLDFEDAADSESLEDSLESIEQELRATDFSEDIVEQMDSIDAMQSSSLGFKPGDGKGASFFGMGAHGTAFVFVVDCSGSMSEENRWIAAKQELKAAIVGLTKDQEFFVFLYNDDSFSHTRGSAKLMKASIENKEKVFKWLDKRYPVGDTRPWRAMKTSLRLKPNAIFFLSDGELKDETVVKLREANGNLKRRGIVLDKVPVHTISLGSGYGSETMKAIAEQNDGTFTHVRTW